MLEQYQNAGNTIEQKTQSNRFANHFLFSNLPDYDNLAYHRRTEEETVV